MKKDTNTFKFTGTSKYMMSAPSFWGDKGGNFLPYTVWKSGDTLENAVRFGAGTELSFSVVDYTGEENDTYWKDGETWYKKKVYSDDGRRAQTTWLADGKVKGFVRKNKKKCKVY